MSSDDVKGFYATKIEGLEKARPIAKPSKTTQRIPLEKLRAIRFNPPHRIDVERRKTYELAEQIADAGGQLSPAHVYDRGDGTYDILAGHRRKTALESLGETHLIAFVHTREEIPKGTTYARWAARFMKNEGSAEPWTSKDWLYAFHASNGEVTSPHPPTAKAITNCVELFGGIHGLAFLIEHDAAPNVARLGNTLHFRMREKIGEDVPSVEECARWFVKYGGSKLLSHIENLKFPAEVLRRWRKAIEKDAQITYLELTISKAEMAKRAVANAPESVRPAKAAKRP